MTSTVKSIEAKEGGEPFEIYITQNGYCVRRGSINPMPAGANNYKSVESAAVAVALLERSGGDENRFWAVWFRATGATQNMRAKNHAMAASLGMRIIRESRYGYRWEKV